MHTLLPIYSFKFKPRTQVETCKRTRVKDSREDDSLGALPSKKYLRGPLTSVLYMRGPLAVTPCKRHVATRRLIPSGMVHLDGTVTTHMK